MQTSRGGRVEAADHFAGRVGDADQDRRRLFGRFSPELLGGRVWRRFAAGRGGALALLALLTFGPVALLQVEGDRGAKRRIGRDIRSGADVVLGAETRIRHVREGGLDGKERAFLCYQFGGGDAERTVVVENVDTAPERANHEIVHLALNGEVADLNGRETDIELDPFLAPDLGEVEAELRADEQQVPVDVIFGDGIDAARLRKIAGDVRPGFALVGALENVRFEVAVLMAIVRDVDDTGVVLRGEDALDVGV